MLRHASRIHETDVQIIHGYVHRNGRILAKEGKTDLFNCGKEFVKEFVRAQMVEAKWINEGHIPTTEEHDSVVFITGGANLLTTTCYLGMSDKVTKDAVEWAVSEPPLFRCSGIHGRRLNDLVSHEVHAP
ncbi:amorpha-4,11-diene synthase [Tanacetum coccineum]